MTFQDISHVINGTELRYPSLNASRVSENAMAQNESQNLHFVQSTVA